MNWNDPEKFCGSMGPRIGDERPYCKEPPNHPPPHRPGPDDGWDRENVTWTDGPNGPRRLVPLVQVYSDPSAVDEAMTVGQLRASLEGRSDDQLVVVDTGHGYEKFLPVYGVADDDKRAVLEL